MAMFTHSILNLSNEEQLKKWGPLASKFQIHGCYAQTEIGHGSNVAGLETEAVFDPKTDEFVINTPIETATKWWPGDMGRYSNYALVFAQLIIVDENGDRNSYGVCPFIVPIRCPDTHKWLKGIKSGDIGSKFGYNSKDNGWLTFDHVRIPRDHMLQKFISVDRDGSVSINGDLRVLYSTMMLIRQSLICWTKYYLAKALTIAIRYSIVRRQFKNISGRKEETQLLDYQTQQQKLFPIVARMFA
jgi:acyl-CoA oxidase